MAGDVVIVGQVGLLFVNNALKQPGGNNVALLLTDLQKLAVRLNGMVFLGAVGPIDGGHVLPGGHLAVFLGGGLAAQLLDAFGKGLGMAHFINGDELHVGGKFAVIHVVQAVVLVHVLVDGEKLHGPGLVEHFNDFFFPAFPAFCHDLLLGGYGAGCLILYNGTPESDRTRRRTTPPGGAVHEAAHAFLHTLVGAKTQAVRRASSSPRSAAASTAR